MRSLADKKLLLLAMGGTIAFTQGPDGAMPGSNGSPSVPHESVDSLELLKISSIGLEDHHLFTLLSAIEQGIEDGYQGIVITHGTDAMEETAYFLALTVQRGRIPVVLTGAMRPNGRADSDGSANLLAALRVARTPIISETGPVVVMGDEIHAARFVTKAHATRISPFESSIGPLGQVLEDKAVVSLTPLYQDYVGTVSSDLPKIAIATMAIADDPRALHSLIAISPAGIVISGLGAGHIPPAMAACVDEAVQKGIPVVVASRCGDGPTLESTYGVPGAELDLQARGAVMAGGLSAQKARLRLAVALANGISPQRAFPVI